MAAGVGDAAAAAVEQQGVFNDVVQEVEEGHKMLRLALINHLECKFNRGLLQWPNGVITQSKR
jgi:hypothetical protein